MSSPNFRRKQDGDVAGMTSPLGSDRADAYEVTDESLDERLPANALRAWRIESALGGSALAVGLAVLLLFLPVSSPALALMLFSLLAASLLVETAFLTPRRFDRYSYSVRPEYVAIRRGVVIRVSTTLPTDKILYVQVSRGPVLKALGLANVNFGTIGEPIKVGPITLARAERLQAEIGGKRKDADSP
jgi:membrane protein YdbS with pleckstrin-like domain